MKINFKKISILAPVIIFFFLIGSVGVKLVFADTPTATPYRTPGVITIQPKPVSTSTPICGTPVPASTASGDYIQRCAQCVTGLTPYATPTKFINTPAPTLYYPTSNATSAPTPTAINPVTFIGSSCVNSSIAACASACNGASIEGICLLSSHSQGRTYNLLGTANYWTTTTGNYATAINSTRVDVAVTTTLCNQALGVNQHRQDQNNAITGYSFTGNGTTSILKQFAICKGDYFGPVPTSSPGGSVTCGQDVIRLLVVNNDGGFDVNSTLAFDGNKTNYSKSSWLDTEDKIIITALVDKTGVTKVRIGDLNGALVQVFDDTGNIIDGNGFGSLTNVGYDYTGGVNISRIEISCLGTMQCQLFIDAVITNGCPKAVNDCRNPAGITIVDVPVITFINRTCQTIIPPVSIAVGWLTSILDDLGLEGLAQATDADFPGIRICISNYSFVRPKLIGMEIPVDIILMASVIAFILKKFYRG